jgi:ABC-type multidrug transport system permease subunit
MRSKSAIGAYILIGLGILFLLSNLGWIPPIRLLVSQWWPLILIIVGILVLIRHSSRPKP